MVFRSVFILQRVRQAELRFMSHAAATDACIETIQQPQEIVNEALQESAQVTRTDESCSAKA